MDETTLLTHIDRLLATVSNAPKKYPPLRGAQAQVVEFLSAHAGAKSAFTLMADGAAGGVDSLSETLSASLEGFRNHLKAGLANSISPKRQAQIDVVSDFLEQAQMLLGANKVHPVAPIVLIGASLEEFLRSWVESLDLSLGQRKPSIDSYSQVLAAAEKISKQDVKDLTAWGGLRNHAAHGEWQEVSDKQRASIMLEGVNLFMRKYS